MQVTLDLSTSELTLLYLMTGNEQAGRIVREIATQPAADNPKDG